jgi:hypothetical protein
MGMYITYIIELRIKYFIPIITLDIVHHEVSETGLFPSSDGTYSYGPNKKS